MAAKEAGVGETKRPIKNSVRCLYERFEEEFIRVRDRVAEAAHTASEGYEDEESEDEENYGYGKCEMALRGLDMLRSEERATPDERVLLLDLWQSLEGDARGGVSPESLKTFVAGILNFKLPQLLVEGVPEGRVGGFAGQRFGFASEAAIARTNKHFKLFVLNRSEATLHRRREENLQRVKEATK